MLLTILKAATMHACEEPGHIRSRRGEQPPDDDIGDPEPFDFDSSGVSSCVEDNDISNWLSGFVEVCTVIGSWFL